MLTLNFRTQEGQIFNRKFPKSVGLSLYGKATTVTGFINPGTGVQINVTDELGRSFYSNTTLTDVFGDFDFWFRTPDYDTKLNIKLIASYPVSGQDVLLVPIAIGNKEPGTMPDPEKEFSALEFIPILLVVAAGFLVYQTVRK